MPYNSRGVETVRSCKRIEMKQLRKRGHLTKGGCTQATLNWHDNFGNSCGYIGIECSLTDQEKWIRLVYTRTNRDGEKEHFNYKIMIETLPSNLGFGEVLYFVCPVSGKYCRILYMGYGSSMFKCRSAYRNRIYYPDQTNSKYYYGFQKCFNIESKLEELDKTRMKKHYRGRITRTFKRYNMLVAKLEDLNGYRLGMLMKNLNRITRSKMQL